MPGSKEQMGLPGDAADTHTLDVKEELTAHAEALPVDSLEQRVSQLRGMGKTAEADILLKNIIRIEQQ